MTKATAEDAADWIAFQSEDYDSFGGEHGYGFARATTDDVAAGLGIDSETAYRLLKAAARKKLVVQDKERRKGVSTGRFGASQVGWAIWEVYLTEAQTRTRDPEHPELTPNVSSQLEWIKGSGVDSDGHNLTWWKNKVAKWKSQYDRPTVFIQVLCWDRTGASTRDWPQFEPSELKEAKAWAKDFIERTGGSCRVDGRVVIPYQGSVTIELGEWKNNASNGFYVWSVDGQSFVPVNRNGPFADPEEAVQLAKRKAKAGSTYDEVITFGADPEATDFYIWKSFKA